MKYQVGDLINNRWGNVDKLGYVYDIKEEVECIVIIFFENTNLKHTFSFHGFEMYHKVINDKQNSCL
jgi:hypothetical protein